MTQDGSANGATEVIHEEEAFDTEAPITAEGEACYNDILGQKKLLWDPEEDNIEDEDWDPKKENGNVADNENGDVDDIDDFKLDFRHKNVKGKHVSGMVDQNIDKAMGSTHKSSIEARPIVNSSSDDEEGRR